MRFDARALFAPLVALLSLLVVAQLTVSALRASGAWRREAAAARPPADPFAPLERALAAASGPEAEGALRDPFSFAPAPVAASGTTPRPVVRRPPPPPPPARPVLTAIVWDNDPRATVRWDGRDYSVRPNGLFADFRVVRITRDQVVLDRDGESLVLTLPARQP